MKDEKVFIIAEMSANHGNDIEVAKETIRAAKRAGADAIKLQTYKPETITLNHKSDNFLIKTGGVGDGTYLYDLYKEAHLPWEWHKELFNLAKEEQIICFSSPFDFSAVDLLEKLNSPIYKIASYEITDIPLIKYVASKRKPVIISTGCATFKDIELAISTIRAEKNNDITVLKCTSAYPSPISDANINMIKKYKDDFNVNVGISDHTKGITVPIASVAIGAKVVEKHFILDKSIGGYDVSFSLDENEFTNMVKEIRNVEKALGNVSYTLSKNQIQGKKYSRSLFVIKDIKKGELFSYQNIRSIRPGNGLHPKLLESIIGKKSTMDISKGDPLKIKHIDRLKN